VVPGIDAEACLLNAAGCATRIATVDCHDMVRHVFWLTKSRSSDAVPTG